MSDDLNLFDPSLYGPGRRKRNKTSKPQTPVEALSGGWTYMRNRHGVLSHAHIVYSTADNGASYTLCGKLGTVMSEPGVDVMRRCPMCDVASQLA
jgi:hypothetical protein